MPQASDEEREWATAKFGSIMDSDVSAWLQTHGLKLGRDWIWRSPLAWADLDPEERRAIWFLVAEWDYGTYKQESR